MIIHYHSNVCTHHAHEAMNCHGMGSRSARMIGSISMTAKTYPQNKNKNISIISAIQNYTSIVT